MNKQDQHILDYVEGRVPHDMFLDILHHLEEDATYDYSIEGEPKGEYQEEDTEWVEGIWVDQTTNGGISGDEFAGTISIMLDEDEYFQFNYSM